MKNWPTSSTRARADKARVFAALIAAVLLSVLLSLCLGAVRIPPGEVLAALRGRLHGSVSSDIVLLSRLPRTCGCLLAGASLAASGTIIQSVLHNPLAAPNTIGVNAGAGLTVALFTALFPTATALVPLAAFLGALAGALLVLFVAERTGAARITLVLTGVALSSMFGAGIDAVVTFLPDALNGYSDFRIGGLANLSMARVLSAFWVFAAALLLALLLSDALDILMLGADTAQSLGLPVKPLRLLLLGLAAAMAGAAVSFAGLLGFVGLIVPHIMRSLVGEESRTLLPAAALGGAAMLTLCDLASRLLFAPYELPVGITLSLLGGPFFIWLILRQRGGRLHD